jgi:protein tyrosine/serine phosphatase
MLTAIILSLCGVKPEDIVEDYSLSANVYAEMNDHQAMVGALSQRSLDPKTFLGAPPQAMRDTLMSIEEHYGSVEGYCNWIGFGPDQQQKLREAVLND